VASTYPNRQIFIKSVIKYLRDYHLDGVDLDWEYPAATDRGGNPDDINNLVNLLAELREAFEREDPGWEISVTLPTSYWYLRGFDMERMQKYVDYFNMMTYDLHGMWDQDIEWTGPYLRGHTDIKQIDQGLDLLWRNGVKPENVVFGLAFYGRSFTMDNPNCYEPNGVCQFSNGGRPGTCSDTSGILTFAEVSARNHSLDVDTFYEPDTTVKYNTYEGDQWISYDDAESFLDKKKFLTERCLSGLMIWAIDQDDGDFNALSGVFGADISDLQLSGGGLDDNAKDALADIFGSYTGQDCFVTPRCTDGSNKEENPDQICPSGFTSITTAHNPLQAPGHERHGDCAEGWYRHVCCPKKALPQNCEWTGAPERSSFGCNGQCGEHQFQLNQDTALDAKGEGSCFTGHRSLCCDSTAAIYSCKWTECQGPFTETELPSCPDDQTYMTYRLDKPNGKPWCSDTFVNVDGFHGWPPHYTMKSALCCPKARTPRGCSWTNDNFDMSDPDTSSNAWDLVCKPQECPSGTVAFARALHPATSKAQLGNSGISCNAVEISPHTDPEFSFCCDPPSRYNQDWPVDPKNLWEHYYNDPDESDVVWKYSNEYNKNNNDEHRAAPGAEDGTDAYGFVMLDGPEGSIDNSFADTQTVVRRSPTILNKKRSVVTTNQTLMDEVFDHSEETLHIYCNYPAGSRECERIFIDGAEDTIIRLPDHIGEGPFARIVSIKPAHEQYKLPNHHVEHRRVKRNENPIYEVKIDYNFHLIHPKRADEPVNIRVDYTNLLGYWGEMTNSPASRMKRGMGEPGLIQAEWKDRVKRASARQNSARSRPDTPVHVSTEMEMPEGHIQKRWWGAFRDWLAKLVRGPRFLWK
jgi:chitinase